MFNFTLKLLTLMNESYKVLKKYKNTTYDAKKSES